MDAIFFDIDDTLYDLAQPYLRAFEAVYAGTLGIVPEELFAASRVHSDERFGEMSTGKITLDEYHADRVQRTFADFGVELSFDEAIRFQRTYEGFQKEIFVTPVVEAMLDACAASGVPMGIISNGTSEGQGRKVRTLGLTRWFAPEHIIISGEVGLRKPDPAIFQLAAERLGVRPQECWYVGDTFGNDIVPAAEAGWHAVWLNRRGHAVPEAPVPDAIVSTEEEMAELVEELLTRGA